MSWLNHPLILFVIVALPLFFAWRRHRSLFWRIFFSSEIIVIFSAQAIKRITAQLRPFQINPHVLGVKTHIPNDYSFPSLHTALATIFAWAMSYLYPRLSWLWFGILALVAFSRYSLGLHYPRDIVAGFALATFVFWLLFLIAHIKSFVIASSNSNVRRKLFHLFYGLGLAILIIQNLLTPIIFLAIILFIAILMIVFPILPAMIRQSIKYFERGDKSLLMGPFTFTLSAFISYLIFPPTVAAAAILNLAIGDSVNALVGTFLKTSQKRLEATLAAASATFLVVLPYFSVTQALAASGVTAILEFTEPTIRGRKIDDNFLIPIFSGFVIQFLGR